MTEPRNEQGEMKMENTQTENSAACVMPELTDVLGVKVGAGETAKERRERLKRAKEIAKEEEEQAEDAAFAARRAFRKDREDRIFMEYAKVILAKVLELPEVQPGKFSWGSDEEGKEMRNKVRFAVANMASELTHEHLKRNP